MIRNIGNDLSKALNEKNTPASLIKFESPQEKLVKENRSLKYYNARLVRALKEIRELGVAYDANGSYTLSKEARAAEKIIFELGY